MGMADLRVWITKPLVVAVAWVLAVAGAATAGVFAYQTSTRADRIDALEADVAEMEDSLAETEAAAAEAEATAEELASQVEELDERATRLGRANRKLKKQSVALERRMGAGACSAAGLDSEPAAQPGLPAGVAEMRAAIVRAATDCDYEELASLALAGDSEFIFSFGGGEDPAAFWRSEEGFGHRPLWFLVRLLDLPFRTLPPSTFVWPSAFGYGDWTSIPEPDKEALGAVYDADDLAGFAEFGGYIGYRVGITRRGDWTFVVAGD